MFQTANPAVTTTPAALKTFVTATGVVTSITNSDGTLTISPTSGAAVASLALGHANTWTGIQTFSTANGIVYSGATTGTQVACLGLDASNNVIKSAAACGSGGGGTPAGPSSAVQYNNSSAFGGDASFEFVAPGKVTIAGGSIAANAAALTITQTWNNNAVVFDAPLLVNVTNTLSGANSLLADFQVGASSLFNVTKTGLVNIAAGPTAGIQIGGTGGLQALIYVDTTGTNSLVISSNNFGTNGVMIGGNNFYVGNASVIGWKSSTANTVGSPDTALFRGATAGYLSLANQSSFTSGTGFAVYNTVDNPSSPTNYERGVFDWTTQTSPVALSIGSQSGGTGSARPVLFVSSGMFAAAGPALPACNTTAVPGYPNGTKGFQAVVSDATAPTYNATYTSGGAIVAHVVCNGTNWVTQ
jgi:hypothetical protein